MGALSSKMALVSADWLYFQDITEFGYFYFILIILFKLGYILSWQPIINVLVGPSVLEPLEYEKCKTQRTKLCCIYLFTYSTQKYKLTEIFNEHHSQHSSKICNIPLSRTTRSSQPGSETAAFNLILSYAHKMDL